MGECATFARYARSGGEALSRGGGCARPEFTRESLSGSRRGARGPFFGPDRSGNGPTEVAEEADIFPGRLSLGRQVVADEDARGQEESEGLKGA